MLPPGPSSLSCYLIAGHLLDSCAFEWKKVRYQSSEAVTCGGGEEISRNDLRLMPIPLRSDYDAPKFATRYGNWSLRAILAS